MPTLGIRPLALCLCLVVTTTGLADDQAGFVELFPREGTPAGWSVREWNDLKKVVLNDDWKVKEGILASGPKRGTWLVSDAEYEDFTLEFEIKLSERGNSGVALRAPMFGDPAFDGMELQIADFRYNTSAKDSELTGGIYRAIAPSKQVYRPTEWNHFQIVLKGSHLTVHLNGELIQDTDLRQFDRTVKRHDNSDAPAVKDRPGRGHIGFQFLSRDPVPVQIRKARLKATTPQGR